MDHLISQYIDDELSLDEKTDFLHKIHQNTTWVEDAVHLIDQEKMLRSAIKEHPPALHFRPRQWRWHIPLFGGLAGALVTAVLFFLIWTPASKEVSLNKRFVIYQPQVNRVEIAGSFTDWKPVSLHRAGAEGYWEVSLPLRAGEHHYSFIFEGTQHVPDPTVLAREKDDFGAFNSIIAVGAIT